MALGLGFTMVRLDEYAVAVALFGVACTILFFKSFHWTGITKRPKITKTLRLVFAAASVTFALLLFEWTNTFRGVKPWSGIGVRWWPSSAQKVAPITTPARPIQPAERVTLQSLFKEDFPTVFKSTMPDHLHFKNGAMVEVQERLYEDFLGRSSFVGLYIPETPLTFAVCKWFASDVPAFIKGLTGTRDMAVTTDGYETTTKLTDLVFSGRVYIYHETPLTLQQKASLTDYYKSKHLDVQFRGIAYVQEVALFRAKQNK